MLITDKIFKRKITNIVEESILTRNKSALMVGSNGNNRLIPLEDQIDLNNLFMMIDKCRKEEKTVRVYSEKLKIIYDKLKAKSFHGFHFIDFTDNTSVIYSRYVKRLMDLVISFLSIIILLPLLIIISVLIKLTSDGPVLFSQDRIGLNGRIFRIYKFRTMHEISGEDEERKRNMLAFMRECKTDGNTKVVNSKRITRLGRFLRKTSLDELPQLINVVKGDMSLVGPRPDLPYVYDLYESWQKKRINVMPGCTGLWQVTGRSQVSFQDSMILDLYYTYRLGLLLDIKILLKTIPVIIFSRGGA